MIYEPKDLKRIMDIKEKSNNDTTKAVSLANKMASLITDAEKCKRRFEASCWVFGNSHPVTLAFYYRHSSLTGITLSTPHTSIVQPPVVKISTPKTPSRPVEWGSQKPQGELKEDDTTLVKGKSKGILEIWKTWSLSIIHIYREGTPNGIGASCNFFGDGGVYLFGAKMVDWCGNEYSQEAEIQFGKPESSWKI